MVLPGCSWRRGTGGVGAALEVLCRAAETEEEKREAGLRVAEEESGV